MEVDTEEHWFDLTVCSSDHNSWAYQVSHDSLTRRLSMLTKPWRDDIKKMNDLLVWKIGIFMRPKFRQESNGLTAYQCYWDWDANGVSLPDALEDPELLADLVQAKRNREFQITEWLETWAKRDEFPIWPEEYFEHPGMNDELFRKLFHRDPTPELKALFVPPVTKT